MSTSTYKFCVKNRKKKKKKKKSLKYRYLLPDLASRLTLSGSKYPCLEQVSMVQKMFEPLKFDCNNPGYSVSPSAHKELCLLCF